MQHVVNNQLLNDDCMLEIFEYLNVKDLCTVAQVSLQFEKLAQIMFRIKYRKFKLEDHFTSISKNKLRALFINFGKYMEHLDITTRVFKYDWTCATIQTYTIWLIKQNCTISNRLRILKLDNFSGIGRNFRSLEKILDNLEVLEVKRTALPYSIPQLLSKLPKAKALIVGGCFIKLPISQYATTRFNPNMKVLKLLCLEEFNTTDVLNYIDIHFPNLKEFHLNLSGYLSANHENYTMGLIRLANIKTLKKLHVNHEISPTNIFMRTLAENDVQLEQLNMRYCKFDDETISYLCKIRTIRELGLTRNLGLNNAHLIQLSEQLPNLEILSAWTHGINIPTIIEIMKNTKHLLKAEFELARDQVFTPHNFNKIINIVRMQNKSETFKLYIHNFFGRSTNMSEDELLRNTTYDKLIQIQRFHTVHSSILFD